MFQNPAGGGNAYGYPAEVLEHIIDAILDAQQAGKLPTRYSDIAHRVTLLDRGLRRLGIIDLIDEATGYQRIREQKALATILEKLIAADLRSWTRTFPYEFYAQIFRLKGWQGPDGVKRPSVIGHYTNDIVYARLAPGVLGELRRKKSNATGWVAKAPASPMVHARPWSSEAEGAFGGSDSTDARCSELGCFPAESSASVP